MNWAEPTWWWMLLGVAAVMVALWWTSAWHMRRLAALFGPGMLDRIVPTSVRTRRQARDAMAVTGLLLLVMALVEPRFGKRLVELEAEGVDLVLAVDLSRSMDAEDVNPSRLERARREVLDLVDLFEGDRVGLVVYAGGPYPRMPLTLDYSALRMVVRELDTRTFQAQGSALGLAIREGLKLLENQGGTAGQAMIVLTDGEVHEPEDALAAANEARDAGVAVYGLIIGTRAASIPNGDGTFMVDPTDGSQVTTSPNAEVLNDVARITGGAVVQSVASNADVVALYRDTIRPSLRTAVGRRGQREAWNTAFQWPLAAGLLCLLLSAWLGDGKRLVTLALVLLMLPAVAQAETVHEGDVAYRQGRYEEAVRIFTDLTLERPDDAELFERLGAARYRAGDYNGAARAFERQSALKGDDPDADFNAGNAYWRSGQLDRALERYDDVLAKQPNHPGATNNKQVLSQELEQRKLVQQQKQQQQPPDQDNPEDDPSNPPQEGDNGEPQEGDGEPQPGQGEPQDEAPQDASQSSASEDAESEEGDPQDQQDGDASSSGAQQQDDAGDDPGTRQEDAPENGEGPTELEDVQDGEQAEGEGAAGGGTPEGDPQGTTEDMSAAQADRVLESVEEGRPRVYIPGERGSKPW